MSRRNSDLGWDAGAATALTALLIAAAIAAAVFVAAIAVAFTKELGRIFVTASTRPTGGAKTLWIGLAALLGAWTLSGLLATRPETAPLAALVAGISFLGFVLFAECVDHLNSRHDQERLEDAGNLDSYLEPFGEPLSVASPARNGNGKTGIPVGVK